MNIAKIDWLESLARKIKSYPYLSSKLPTLIILLITIIYFVLVLLIITPVYNVNDDIDILLDIKSGFLTSLMSRIFGTILSFFYINLSNSIPWYGVFYYISIGISLLVLLRLFLIEKSAKNIAIYILILVLYTKFIQIIGYNGASIITGGIATLGVFIAFCRNRIFWYTAIGYGLMLCLCFLWRIQCLPFVVVFLFPILVLKLLTAKNRKYYTYFAIFILPCVILYACETYFYHYKATPEQKKHDEYMHYGMFRGWGLDQLNRDNQVLLKELGWTQNDLLIYSNWFYVDDNKYSLEKAKQLINSPVLIKPDKADIPTYIKYVFDSAKAIFYNSSYRDIWIVIIGELILIIMFCNFSSILLSFIFVIYTTIAESLLRTQIHYPDRWGIPMFFIIACFLAYLLLENNTKKSMKRLPIWKIISLLIMALLMVLILKTQISHLGKWTNSVFFVAGFLLIYFLLGKVLIKIKKPFSRWEKISLLFITFGVILVIAFNVRLLAFRDKINRIERQNTYYNINIMKSLGTNSVFLTNAVFSDMFIYNNPLKEDKNELSIIPTGWPIFSPRFYENIHKIGLKHGSEVFPYMIHSKNAFLICNKESLESLYIFIKETYGIETNFKLIDSRISLSNSAFNIYKIEEIPKQT
jgi:hypothetical protein